MAFRILGREAMNKPLEGMRAFLSGPMSGIDGNNVIVFIEAHRRLRELGARYVYNPALEWVNEFSKGMPEMGHGYYMRRCVNELTKPWVESFDSNEVRSFYDVLVQLEGWEESDGARTEKLVAEACGIRCVRLSDLDAIDGNGEV